MVINFGTGPAKIPAEVLLEVQKNLINYNGHGISVMEMSHRGSLYHEIHNKTIENLRELLEVPENYKILLMQGGGNGMFSAICLNLMGRTGTADYVVTGFWSQRAAEEAETYGKVNYVLPKTPGYHSIPPQSEWKLDPKAAFVFYCDNETANGIEFNYVPETNGIPLVCDMSSNFLSKKINFQNFGLIFAAAHKGFGTVGATVVIVRDDLIGNAMKLTPTFLNFETQVKCNSIFNTPPIFPIYVMGCVFEWIKRNGGIEQMILNTKIKSKLIYDVIDGSQGFYKCIGDAKFRSRTSIPFRIGNLNGEEELEKEFLDRSEQEGMIQLSGHISVGGIRVSLYNSITVDEVRKLVEFMVVFCQNNSNKLNCLKK